MRPSEQHHTVARVEATVMAISVGMSVVMLAGKGVAWWVSGSSAILSDAAESVIHGAATSFAAYSLWFSRRPADSSHTYGHGKIAYFSAGFEGSLIFCASLAIVGIALRDLIVGVKLDQLGLGLLITALLCFVNLLLGLSLVRVGRRRHALILVSNGQHVLSDMWTSLGVLVGVGIVYFTGILWLDPVVAMLAGANIGWMGIRLMRRSVGGLLDEADPAFLQKAIDTLDAAQREGLVSGYHQLRMRSTDNIVWMELHVLTPGAMTVQEAHARVTQLEERVRAQMPRRTLHITTHIEPEHHSEAHPDGHHGVADALRGE